MILKSDGTLWATGGNAFGQLGDGTLTKSETTERVMSSVSRVSAGGFHTMVLKSDNTLWATGNNAAGQLGTGYMTDRQTPVQVMSGVSAVSAGYFHTMTPTTAHSGPLDTILMANLATAVR